MAKKTNKKTLTGTRPVQDELPELKQVPSVSEIPTKIESPLTLAVTEDLFTELAYRIRKAGQMGALGHLGAADHAFKR